MFEGLCQRLGSIFTSFRHRGALTEQDVTQALRDMRIIFLEADIALPVVKELISKIQAQALGQEILRSLNPEEMMTKIVFDTLVTFLHAATPQTTWALKGNTPHVFLIVGLQGGGKTTMTAKIAHQLMHQQKKRVFVASLDTFRPAAQNQLYGLIQTMQGHHLMPQNPNDVVALAQQALRDGQMYDVILLDTAGRQVVNEELMNELKKIHDIARPHETLLVLDALMGQDAFRVTQGFMNALSLTGLGVSRMDADTRGGCVLSAHSLTKLPIKMLGMGEKAESYMPFNAERLASNIIGRGDVLDLIEKAEKNFHQENQEKLMRQMEKGSLTLQDFFEQLKKMNEMGGMESISSMLPSAMKTKMHSAAEKINPRMISRKMALIQSMTSKEKRMPSIIKASRRRRIAAGSGQTVADLNRLMKEFDVMQTMFKQMGALKQKALKRSVSGKKSWFPF